MDKSDDLKKLGQRIKELRLQRGMSQAKFAVSISKDQQSIFKVEAGQFNPSYIYLLELARGLNISLSELLDFDKIE